MNLQNIFQNATDVKYDDHTEPHYNVTAGQLTFSLIWAVCTILWLFRYNGKEPNDNHHANRKENDVVSNERNNAEFESKSHYRDVEKGVEAKNEPNEEKPGKNVKAGENVKASENVKVISAVRPKPSVNVFLKHVSVFGLILFYFYLCDYRKIFPKLERVYSRDEFLFLVFLLFLVACAFTIKPTTDKILNRDQTEEWKGWMQVMFVWYHVFRATEWYNWIRVYIAAYVWMTGFGNFSFFWVRKDFSLWRFMKMQFRLNFLVTCICVVTGNQYMLYYICAMHSYWFISVYVFMGVLKSWNTDSKKMFLKFCVYFLFNCIIFEIPVVKSNIFRPFQFLLGFSVPKYGLMHEWAFRAGLDHWACFFGMICAYNYPHFENFINDLEKSDDWKRRLCIKILMVTTCVIGLVLWYSHVMTREKYSYNDVHPYTSLIPVFCFIILRNSFATLRSYYIELFAWLGKITLETYLSQLHIYLQSNAKHFIGYIPNYHFLNFALATVIYLPVSYILFNLTTEFSSYLLPNDMKVVTKNAIIIAIVFTIPYLVFTILLAM